MTNGMPSSEQPAKLTASVRRQAVVVIHGIGEQRPMATLRSFVAAVLPPGSGGLAGFYNKPDPHANNFELRRLIGLGNRPKTDFFEFYWAHLMPVATWQRILAWSKLLVFRPRHAIPGQLRPIWHIAWAGIVIAGTAIVLLSLFALVPDLRPAWWPVTGIVLATIPAVAIVLGLFQGFILSYVGDAAVYLSAHPQTVAARQDIRAAGIDLLEKLHRCGEYDRIVLVGHSLGSVIGYDLLRLLWYRLRETHGRPDRPQSAALEAMEELVAVMGTGPSEGRESPTLDEYRTAVHNLWLEQRTQGFPWLITDFVTLGSPLAHATLLLADGPEAFSSLRRENELPVCPPEPDHGGRLFYHVPYVLANGAKRTIKVLGDSAPFAVTRWTNLYFPCRGILHGDVVGGPLAPVFSHGIQDVAIATRRRRGYLSHTFYWTPFGSDKGRFDAPLPALKKALALERGGRSQRQTND